MGKFNISTVQPGQVDEATQSLIETPVEQVQEKTPQAQGSAFEALLNQEADVDVEAAAQEITEEASIDPDIAAQQERERVAPLKERIATSIAESPKWQTKEVADTKDGMSNLIARAGNMKTLIDNKELSAGWGIGAAEIDGKRISTIAKEQGPAAAQQALQVSQASSPSGILSKMGATAVIPGTAQVAVDPKFAGTLSVVTENFMMGAQTASEAGLPKEKVDEFTGQPTGELVRPAEDYQVSKSQGNTRLGTDIHREFQRTKNQAEGRPTDEYQDLSPAEATTLGDLAKELYYQANADLIDRTEGTDGQVYFTVNAKGADLLTKSNEARKRLFPTQNVRPSKTVLPGGEFVGEGAKLSGKFTKKAGKLGNISLIEEAMQNLHEVPNVVDPRRSRVLISTALPAILQAIQGRYDGRWNNTVGLGTTTLADFEAAKALAAKQEARAEQAAARRGEPYTPKPEYNVRSNMDSQVDKMAQSIRAVALERKGANYLTYAMQSFTGRVHPQQTYFDPTSSKAVRFATRNATPAIAKPGNRVERNLKQMYAMMMISEASEALPNQRLELLKIHGPKMYEMGATIETALNNQISNDLAEQIAVAIENNIPLTDPRFPQVPELDLPNNIVAYIESKGDDALSVLEGLVDYKNFVDAMKEGKPHATYFNAYMDGKTNGIANNGLQLGNEKIAERTGVIRTQGKRLLDNDLDVRAALRNELSNKLSEGIEGMSALDNPAAVYNFLQFIAQDKPLSKATTMQFGYGKELDSFKQDMEEIIERLAISNPEEYKMALDQFQGNEGKLRDTAHAFYMDGLINALSPEAADARAVMRANATMYALTDQLFSIKGPSGFNINMGSNEILPEAIPTRYDVKGPAGKTRTTAYEFKTRPTSAAARGETPGLYAYGRSLPSPVQSIDAATVAKTVTGKSWDKLKQASNGNPYIHTIYDAFKVDANGYDIVLKEANSNWFKSSMDWSYLEQTKDVAKRDMQKFWSEKDKLPNELNTKEYGGARMMNYLMSPRGKDGKSISLTNRITKTLFNANESMEEAGKRAKKISDYALKVLTKMGYRSDSNTVTKEQYLWFVNFMEKNVYNLHAKNSSITESTNKAKGRLRQKIAGQGMKVYQYYSH